MSKIEKFEDMVAWQKARELTRKVYDCSKAGQFAKDCLQRLSERADCGPCTLDSGRYE